MAQTWLMGQSLQTPGLRWTNKQTKKCQLPEHAGQRIQLIGSCFISFSSNVHVSGLLCSTSSCLTSVMIIPFYTLSYLPSTWSPHNKFHPSTAHIQATWIRDLHQPTGISHPGNNNWVPMAFGALCFYSNLIVTVIRAHVLFNSVFLVPGTYKSLS